LWNTFKDLFTVKKTKDLNTTIEKYKLLMETNIINANNSLDLDKDKTSTSSLEENELIENDLNQFVNEITGK
jgi:hypothetical protein